MLENNLFLTDNPESKAEYRRIIGDTVSAVVEAFDSPKAYEGPEPFRLKKLVEMEQLLPDHGLGWEKVLDNLKTAVLPNFLRTSSRDYMAHLHSPGTIESIAGELILSTFNQSMDSWDQSPVATEIEVQVVKCLCKMFGYGENSDGVFTSGGSQSNFSGITLARDWYCSANLNHDIQKKGLPSCSSKFRIYTSEISHFSVEKTAHLLGLGYDSVVKVPVNEKQQMDFDSLERLVKKDAASGNLPVCVVCTFGTTDFGSIDPVEKIRTLCDEYKMYLHGDAAYGSGVILSEKYREKLAGIELCDSITVDFHKMFLLPISCSAVLVKDKKNLDFFTIRADYLNREEDEEDGYTNLVDKSIQTTRRFDALKVWISFQMRGKDGWSEIITKSMENARYFYGLLREQPDFEVVTEPEISSVVFRFVPEGKSDGEEADAVNKKIRRSLIHEKGIVIGQTVCRGRVQLKFTLLNPLLSRENLEEMMGVIRALGKSF